MSRYIATLLLIILFSVSCGKSNDTNQVATDSIQYVSPDKSDFYVETQAQSPVEDSYSFEDDFDSYESTAAELERQEIEDAKRAVVDAQDDLNRSVRSLSYGDWENDLPTLKRRLRALEDANSDLDSLDSEAAANMDWEISRMKREVRRLEDENWRDVVPDIEQQNRSISWESDNLESTISE